MRILFVSTSSPTPPYNGRSIRTLSIVQALTSSGHEVTFVAPSSDGGPAALVPLSSCCQDVDLVDREHKLPRMSEKGAYLARVRCLLSLRPYSLERFRSGTMQARINRHLMRKLFDLIMCDSLDALVNMPRSSVPTALNCHNIEYVIFQRYAQIEKKLLRKWYARIESYLVRRFERRGCDEIDFAMACSEDDRNTLRRLCPNLAVFVVPNVVDATSCESDSGANVGSSESILLFQGGMDWHPNRDAVEFFAKSILPLIRRECPHVRFVIAGRNPPLPFVQAFREDAAIEFTGTIDDMRPYLRAAAVVVVPLRIGSGTRIKILEACAAGKAVVSTSIGAEGLNLKNGTEILVADHAENFARSVVLLLRDAKLRHAIARAGNDAVRNQYTQAIANDRVNAACSRFPHRLKRMPNANRAF